MHLPNQLPNISRRTFILGSLALIACGKTAVSHRALPSGSVVMALGDSLTAGYGASPKADYPQILAQNTGWQVINAGISGDTTADVLRRLPEVLQNQPQLILLSIGGNDFLRKVPLNETEKNLHDIIHTIQKQSIDLVLIAEPQPSISAAVLGHLSDHPIYAELAKTHQLPLFADGWSDILSDSHLRSDTIHANDQGYRQFAEQLAIFLRKNGFLTVGSQ